MMAIAAINARQARESLAIRRCFSKILLLGHAPSANLARVGLAACARSVELDNLRNEHVGLVRGLIASAQRALREMNAAIEQTLVGRSRSVSTACAPS
jgi:hypothetical protein